MADVPATVAASNGVSVDEAPGVKLYIGNLPYSVRDEQLKEFFASVDDKILSCQVIMHGSRSAGYGFVSLATQKDAEDACGALHETTLGERSVKVQLAKPAEQKEKEKGEKNTKRRVGRRGDKAAAGEVTEAEANGETEKPAETTDGGEGRPKKRKSPRKKSKAKTAAGSVDGAENGAAVPPATEGAAAPEKRAPRTKRTPKPKREPGEEPVGEHSQTTLFVHDLSFSLDDAGLAAIFTDAGFKVTSAHIVRRRWGHPRRSKGYGFVELEDEEKQKEALEKLQDKEVDGRAIKIKVAINQNNVEENGDEKAENDKELTVVA